MLHDADLQGCKLAAEVQSGARWFGGVDGAEVVDAGLRPTDANRFRGLYLEGSPSTADVLSEPVSVEEARWLEKHRLELEAVRPRLLMSVLGKILSRGTDDVTRRDAGEGVLWIGAAWGAVGDGDGDGHGDGDGGDGGHG